MFNYHALTYAKGARKAIDARIKAIFAVRKEKQPRKSLRVLLNISKLNKKWLLR